jgi:hypothetical protein
MILDPCWHYPSEGIDESLSDVENDPSTSKCVAAERMATLFAVIVHLGESIPSFLQSIPNSMSVWQHSSNHGQRQRQRQRFFNEHLPLGGKPVYERVSINS